MTDRDVLIEMLDRAGVKWEDSAKEPGAAVIIEALTGPSNRGYNGFVAIFVFDQGKLDRVGVWE
jgi:hypothetical protein